MVCGDKENPPGWFKVSALKSCTPSIHRVVIVMGSLGLRGAREDGSKVHLLHWQLSNHISGPCELLCKAQVKHLGTDFDRQQEVWVNGHGDWLKVQSGCQCQ